MKKIVFIEIDESNREAHTNLKSDDKCFYLKEYVRNDNFTDSDTNLVKNFKKEMDKKGTSQWYYKEKAIRQVTNTFRMALNEKSLQDFTLAFIPPSKVKSDPMYDDRMEQVLSGLYPGSSLDIRELFVLNQGYQSSHSSTHDRIGVDGLKSILSINPAAIAKPLKRKIILFDDVLTAGTHFRACKDILMEHDDSLKVMGVFLARRVLPTAAESFGAFLDF